MEVSISSIGAAEAESEMKMVASSVLIADFIVFGIVLYCVAVA